MASIADLPPALRPPAGGDLVEFTLQADLGPGIAVGDLGAYLRDLQTVVSMGEAWGLELARAAQRWILSEDLADRGPTALLGIAEDLGVADPKVRHWYYGDFGDLFTLVSDAQMSPDIGPPIRLLQAHYENPIFLVLGGAGLAVAGVIKAVRFVRDWSAEKRVIHAQAEAAEAGARMGQAGARAAEAEAQIAEARADFYRWVVAETKAGRNPVPAGELLKVATPVALAAADRVAAAMVTLELPDGTDPAASDHESG